MIYYYNENRSQIKQASVWEEYEEVIEEVIEADKLDVWEQLVCRYEKNSTLLEHGTYEFVQGSLEILACLAQGQELIVNSFLLHGYYNYHHVLIARAIDRESSYYIAVPGNAYGREQAVASMYGFSQFIAKDETDKKQGTYGYYLRNVSMKEEDLEEVYGNYR